ncbi:glycosyltransferase family 2 protein [Chitinilyticum piscinae]|uniref:Glycosyltransferase family 2 protein n=1 Tax=Chitinilyticum piscinae TaxID=2866724 RepID=A0A8J7K0Y9_9NEIS|nr:glycosyltransferase family 2 protein [Chitinilyticum piscinae]MBE9607822.1 glycosyltransferase family 2 protein [Chitinilyticum piscinae]
MSEFRPCFVIPVYNHEAAIGQVLLQLQPFGLPCLLVDDGSNEGCRATLEALAAEHPDWVRLRRHAQNQGKGGAVMTGLCWAYADGYSHAVQIDADGQHDTREIPQLLSLAEAEPAALVSGYPVYDESVPRGRLYARYLTHVWIWINTLSFTIRDSMCGFRVYPLASSVALLERQRLGRRMDFDPEIMVRMYWAGVTIRQLPTPVHYPLDGVSHFLVWRDNALISRMHARLFCGMLLRSPVLLWRNLRRWCRK